MTQPLVGRERELAELERGLAEALDGTGGLFVVVGEPGIGKTRLADELQRSACGRGFTVHWGRCWEAGGAPAFWPWIQIFRSMLRDRNSQAVATAYDDVLSRLLPELRKGPVPTGELDQAQARFQLFDDLWGLLRAAAQHGPSLLVLDDLHAADPSSLALLQFIVRDLRTNRVVVVATYRDREASPSAEVSDAIRAVAREGIFLPLRRLDPDEVAKLLDERSGKPVARELAVALHKATEGNPMFVDQVYRHLAARTGFDTPVKELPIPHGIRDMIRKRVAALDSATRAVLEAAAVIGREFTRELLAGVCHREDQELRACLDQALANGMIAEQVLGSYEFAHALFREALYRELAGPERAQLHARAAEALEASQAPDKARGEIALHLLGAVGVFGARRAAEGALRAAERALSSLAFEDAATILSTMLERLGTALDDDRVRADALVLLGEARARMADHDGARQACEAAAEIARRAGDAELLAHAALSLGVELVPGVITKALVSLLEEALRTLPPEPSALRARVLARLAAALQPAEQPDHPMSLAREAVKMARSIGNDATLRACLHLGGSALVDYAEPSERWAWDGELLRLSIEAGDVIAALRAHVRLIFDALETGDTGSADGHLEAHEQLADGLGIASYRWLTFMLRALRAVWDARFADAYALREQARRVGQRVLTPEMEMSTHLQEWGIAFARGEPLPNVPRVAVLGSRFAGSDVMALVVSMCEHARAGDLAVARALLEKIPPSSGLLTCAGSHLRFIAETCTRVGARAHAEAVYQGLSQFENRTSSMGRVGMFVEGPTTWLLGMLAGTCERWGDSSRLFEKAIVDSARFKMPAYEAIACLEYARVLARRGDAHALRRQEIVARGTALAAAYDLPGVARGFEDLGGAPSVPIAAARPASQADERDSQSLAIEKDGEIWAVRSGRALFRLKDSRGMQMLSELVRHPGREFHVLTLMGSEGADAGDAGDLLDRQAADAYRQRAEDLRDQLAEAESFGDRARSERARAELEQIADELASGMGLGGRPRRARAAAERARINVQRRLRDAIRRIGEQDAKLGRYLDRAVRTGTFCAFEP